MTATLTCQSQCVNTSPAYLNTRIHETNRIRVARSQEEQRIGTGGRSKGSKQSVRWRKLEQKSAPERLLRLGPGTRLDFDLTIVRRGGIVDSALSPSLLQYF